MDKKGVISGLFVFVIGIFIVAGLLIGGFYAIKSYDQKSKEAKIIEFRATLQNEVNLLANKPGSSQTLSLKLPSNVDEVCFISANMKNQLPDIFRKTHPFVDDESLANYDVFIFGKDYVDYFPITQLKIDSLFECVPNKDGQITFVIRGGQNTDILVNQKGPLTFSLKTGPREDTFVYSLDYHAGLFINRETEITYPEGSRNEITVHLDEGITIPSNITLVGPIYTFTPTGVIFSPPIRLMLTYDPAKVSDPQHLMVYGSDGTNWEPLPGPYYVDYIAHTIKVDIAHFTSYAPGLGETESNITGEWENLTSEICNDHLDNDDDGIIDCSDPDCWSDPSCSAQSQATVCNEDFEGDFLHANSSCNWTLTYVLPGYSWGEESCRASTGLKSAWVAGSRYYHGENGLNPCDDKYPNQFSAWMIAGPFNFSDLGDAKVMFDWWLRSEGMNKDLFIVGYSFNGYNFYTHTNTFNRSGDFGDVWHRDEIYSLTHLIGQEKIWIGFAFITDSSISTNSTPNGAFVDNVRIIEIFNGTSPLQEDCNDHIDNDGDGLIDCADPDCTSSADCSSSPTSCNSCIDCSNKLSIEGSSIMLSNDLISGANDCINIQANNVVFDGNSKWIKGSGNANSGIKAEGREGISVKNLKISGYKTGINLKNTKDISLLNNLFDDNIVNTPKGYSWVMIDKIKDNSGQVVVRNNTFISKRPLAFSINPYPILAEDHHENVTIEDNQVNMQYSGTGDSIGFDINKIQNLRFKGNVIQGTKGTGLVLNWIYGDKSLEENVINNLDYGYYLYSFGLGTIRNNEGCWNRNYDIYSANQIINFGNHDRCSNFFRFNDMSIDGCWAHCIGAPPVENCSDGIDNDGDGNIDCTDADCAGDGSCVNSSEIILCSEDFEGEYPGNPACPWYRKSYCDLGYTFGKSNCRASDGSYSAWAAAGRYAYLEGLDACTEQYIDKMCAQMVAGPFNLTGASEAYVQYDYWLRSEGYGRDHMFVGFSDNGVNIREWEERAGDFGDVWHKENRFSLINTTGLPSAYVHFGFYTDGFLTIPEVVPNGLFIDNIKVVKVRS